MNDPSNSARTSLGEQKADPAPGPTKSEGSSPLQQSSPSSSPFAPSPNSSPPTSTEHDRANSALVSKAPVRAKPLRDLITRLRHKSPWGKAKGSTSRPMSAVKEHQDADNSQNVAESKTIEEHQDSSKTWSSAVLVQSWDVAQAASEAWNNNRWRLPLSYNTGYLEVLPPKGEVDQDAPFYTPKPGREEVLQISVRHDVFAGYTESGDQEYKRRAIYIDDPDFEPACAWPVYCRGSNGELFLQEGSKRVLPSPGTCTLLGYQSRRHKIPSIQKAITGPVQLNEDGRFEARAYQHKQHMNMLRGGARGIPAISESKLPKIGPVASPSEFNSLSAEEQSAAKARLIAQQKWAGENEMAPGDALRFSLLRTWELKRDIKALEASQRNLMETRRRLRELSWDAPYSTDSTREWRHVPHPDDKRPENFDDEGSLKSCDDLKEVYQMYGTSANISTETSSGGRPFQYDDNSDWQSALDRKSSSQVYGDCPNLTSDETLPSPGDAQLKLAKAQEALRQFQTQGQPPSPSASEAIQSPAANEREVEMSEKARGKLPIKSVSADVESQEEIEKYDIDPREYAEHDEERYPRIQNFI